MDLKHYITTTPNWPRPGVDFLDIGGVLRDPRAFAACIKRMEILAAAAKPTSLVAIDSRGFLFASPLGLNLGLPIYLARKAGKLPGPCVAHTYHTEYSQATIELQQHCELGHNPMIVDDVLATGGTVLAVGQIIQDNFTITKISALVLINLRFLPGGQRAAAAGIKLNHVIDYDS